MKIDFKTIVLSGVIVLLVLLLLDTCNGKRVAEKEAEAYSNYKDTVLFYKDRSGKQIAYNKALEINEKALLSMNDSLSKALKRLKIKKPNSFTIIKTETSIDSVKVPIADSLPCDSFVYDAIVDSPYYKIDFTLTQSDLTFNSILIPNKQSILVGTKRNGFLRPNEYVVTVENSNPYMSVTGLQNYTVKPKKRWYEKWWLHVAVGAVAGYSIRGQVGK